MSSCHPINRISSINPPWITKSRYPPCILLKRFYLGTNFKNVDVLSAAYELCFSFPCFALLVWRAKSELKVSLSITRQNLLIKCCALQICSREDMDPYVWWSAILPVPWTINVSGIRRIHQWYHIM